MACATCKPLDCHSPDDLRAYSLESGRFFRSMQYGFVINCPPGYTCSGGYYPRTVTYPPGDGTITVPEDLVDDDDTINEDFNDSLECCDTPIPVFAPQGTSLTELESIINSAFEACATAKAACESLQPPAPGVPAPSKGTNKLRMALTSSKACLGTAYGASIISTMATGRVFWKIMSGGLPTGLYLDDQSVTTPEETKSIGISGTPAAVGNYTFKMMMSDSLGYTLTKDFTITVLGITNSPTTATVGTPYSFQFTASGGTGSYTWSVLAAALPDGLTLSASGLLSGTPENTDQNTFNLTVTDSVGQSCVKQFVMTPNPPSVTCATIIAALSWSFFNDPPFNHGAGWAGSGAVITFDVLTALNVGTSITAHVHIINTSAAPITLHYVLASNGSYPAHADAFGDQSNMGGYIIDGSAGIFSGTGDPINPGEDVGFNLQIGAGGSGVNVNSGSLTITCV